MALNNLTNFLNLIGARRLKTTPEPTDVIPLGTPDRKFDGGYKPTFIQYEDLANSILSQLPPSTDANNQKLVIGGEGDELRLRDGTLNGTPVPDSVIPMEQIAQGFVLEDIGGVPSYAGNQNKYLKVNPSGNGVTWEDILIPEDSNTWDIRNVAFLSTFGNDSSAVVGDGNKPYRTFSAAQTASSTIFVKDGSWGTETIVSNKTIYFYPGTQMYRMRDGGATVTNTKVLGHLKFRSFGYGIELTGSGSDIYVECDEFDNTRAIAWLLGTNSKCILKTRKAFCNGFNGGAYACAVRNGSTLELTVTESTTLYYWLVAPRDSNNNFIFRCPDVRQIPGGNYGATAFGSLVNHQGSVTQGNTYLVDFMGGKLTKTRGQGSSFGVRDSALLLYVNSYGAALPNVVKFQNGYVDAGSTLGILIEYIVLSGHVELENIDIKTTSKPIEMSQRANNSGGGPFYCTLVTRNCNFEGDLDCELGNFRILRAFDCNFKTLTGASNFIFNNVNGNSPGEAYFINCNAELVGGPGEMLTGFTGKTIGLLNTYSDEVIGVGAVDTWGGHATIPTLTLPNIKI